MKEIPPDAPRFQYGREGNTLPYNQQNIYEENNMKVNTIAQELNSLAYHGRGIIIGKSADAKKAITAYFIMDLAGISGILCRKDYEVTVYRVADLSQ